MEHATLLSLQFPSFCWPSVWESGETKMRPSLLKDVKSPVCDWLRQAMAKCVTGLGVLRALVDAQGHTQNKSPNQTNHPVAPIYTREECPSRHHNQS